MFKVIIAVVIGAIAVVCAFLFVGNVFSPSQVDQTVNTTYNTITIEGEVIRPGTYSLDEGSTLETLISSAGGISDNADELAFYLDAEIVKGTTYYIAPKYDDGDICATAPISKVNINTDNAESLMEINGISSSVASSIVSYRTGTSLFRTLEELMEVYGIGNATYRKIRNYVVLHT